MRRVGDDVLVTTEGEADIWWTFREATPRPYR